MVSRFPSQRSFPRNERTRLWRLSRATRRRPSSTTDRLVALGRALRAAAMSSSSITILVRMMCKTHENIHIVTDTSSPWYTGFRDLTCPSFAMWFDCDRPNGSLLALSLLLVRRLRLGGNHLFAFLCDQFFEILIERLLHAASCNRVTSRIYSEIA